MLLHIAVWCWSLRASNIWHTWERVTFQILLPEDAWHYLFRRVQSSKSLFEYICGRKVGWRSWRYCYTLALDIIHVALLTSYTDWHLETPLNVYLYRNDPCGETWILVVYIHIFICIPYQRNWFMTWPQEWMSQPPRDIHQPKTSSNQTSWTMSPPIATIATVFMGGNCEFLSRKSRE